MSVQSDLLEINRRFSHHAPSKEQTVIYEELRQKAKELAFRLHSWCPESRERSLAMTHLEQAMFYANAAIARRG